MQVVSLQGILKLILILLLVYYGLKMLTRFLGPVLFKYLTKKASNYFTKQQNYDQHSNFENVNKNTNTSFRNKSSNKDVGEYIDFEEID